MAITRVFDLLDHNLQNFPRKDMVNMKVNGAWINYSVEDFIHRSEGIAKGLLKLGINLGDKVAIMSPNRPEWNFCDFGIMMIGATSVPMYPTLSESDIKFITNDAEVKVLFVADKDLYNKIKPLLPELKTIEKIYSFDELAGVANLSELIEEGKDIDPTILKEKKKNVSKDDLLTLIYTSGTTGTPKGVMLTHNNLVTNFENSKDLCPPNAEIALSFLPMSHIFERMVVYLYFRLGISVYYAESLETIADNLKEVKPHFFTTVPRLLEKVYDKIVAKGTMLTGIKKALFFWALNLGLKFDSPAAEGVWYKLQLKLANKLIFNKWREALGGRVLAIVSGGAALQPRLAKIFTAANMPVFQGYGLTETSPVISVTRPDDNRLGTVGAAIPGVEIKFAEDGEILVKGPNVMKGYYKRPDATAEVIDKDGYFHTGDIGEMQEGRYLKITDRKKEIFKTAGGKYIAPQVMENKFKESKFIEQIMVIGENQRFPSALIVPTFASLQEWCAIKGIQYTNNEEMIKNPQVIDKIYREIAKYNEDFGHWEQVKKIELIPKEFSIDGGELTPKMSMKRKDIMEKYKELVSKIYRES